MADSVKVRIDGDTSGFDKALSSIETGAKKMISSVAKGTVAVGAALGTATITGLNFAGELEQNLGGSEAVFKEYANEMQKIADKAFKNMGLSTSEFLATANKMGALFQGAGFSIEESADLSSQAMQRAADVASIMGIDVSSAMEAIAGAAKGNFTMMDNLGVAMNDTTLNAYALEIGLGKTTSEMTNQEKVALAMQMFLDRTAYAAGNYAKENDTLAGSLTTAKAALENFMAGTGSVDEVVESLTNVGEVIIKNLSELVPKLVKGVGGLVEGLMGQLITMITDNAPQMIEAAVEVISTFVEGIGKNADKIAQAAAVIAQTLITGLLQIIPQIVQVAGQIISEFAKGLANAYPILSPLADIVQFLAKHIEILTAAVVAGVVAWKTAAVVKTVYSWYQKLGTGLNYATIKQYALNLAQSLSPMGLLVTVVAALTAGLITYAVATNTAANAQGIDTDATEKHKTKTEELIEALKEKIETIDEEVASEMVSAEQAMVLKDKLFDLEKQIHSGQLTEEEATKAKEQFNSTVNQLKGIIPEVTNYIGDETDQYALQKGAIDNLVTSYYKLAKAKAMANAYQEKLNEVSKALVEVQDEMSGFHFDPIRGGAWLEKTNFGKELDYNDYLSDLDMDSILEDKGYDYYRREVNATLYDKYDELSATETGLKEQIDAITNALIEEEKTIQDIGGTTKETGSTVTSTAQATTSTVKKEVDEQQAAIEQALKAELHSLEREHKLGIISDKEYYDRLGDIRDRYFEEGSDDWQSYTEEVEGYYDDTLKKVADDYQNLIDKLADKQASLAKKFQEDTDKTYATIQLNADGETQTWYSLADIDNQNKLIQQEIDMLEKLRELRGDIPAQAMSDLQNMDTEEAIRFLQVMLDASDAQWNKWASGFGENVRLSEELSNMLVKDEVQELADRIKEEWGQLPEDFFKIGEDSAERYGEGFMDQLEGIFNEVRNKIWNEFSSIGSVDLFAATAGGAVAGSTTYTDNRTTNIYANGTSPRAIIEADKQNNIYQAHTNTFGG